MTINDILNAKESLTKLNKIKFNNFRTISNIYKLTKKVNSILELLQQENEKIIDIYVLKDSNGKPLIKNNQYQFETVEKKDSFIKESNKLRFEEVSDITKIDININDIQVSLDFSSEDMIKLDSMINWIE